jgi:hypothetical protein
VALGVAAALVLAGAIVLATSPWSEDEPEARMRTVPAEPEPVTLRVMTFNIFYGGDELDLATGDWCARRRVARGPSTASSPLSRPPTRTSSGSRRRR